MNCLELRRLLLQDPHHPDSAMLDHIRTCRACEQFYRMTLEQESGLKAAMQLAVPEGLADRILVQQSFSRRRQALGLRRRLGLAAGIVLALGASLAAYQWWWAASLDRTLVEHIESEPDHLVEADTVDMEQLANMLARLDSGVRRPLDGLRYAGSCPIDNRMAGHLVINSAEGPITILYLPDKSLWSRHHLDERGYHGLVVPFGKGSLAIVGVAGTRDETLLSIEHKVRTALKPAL